METTKKTEPEKQKKNKFLLPLIIILAVIAAGGWYWYSLYNKYISTDDAHLDSDEVSVSSKILGRISHIYVSEGDTIKAGMLLVELDSTDLLAQKKQLLAAKGQALASKIQSEAKYLYDRESIKVLEINYEKAKDDYDRAKEQYKGEVISKETYEHAVKSCEAAKAQLEAAKSQLNVSKAQVGSTVATIESSQAQIGVIETQLGNTKLYAPIDGVVAKRWLLPGDISQPGQSILTLTNNHKLWVTVYIEETKLSKIYLNQPALFTIDAFPHVTFTGKIVSISSNTASRFSLIPPNNASGNFTKVTQRVPLKISIEGTGNKGKLQDYNLIPGMSVVVKIIKK